MSGGSRPCARQRSADLCVGVPCLWLVLTARTSLLPGIGASSATATSASTRHVLRQPPSFFVRRLCAECVTPVASQLVPLHVQDDAAVVDPRLRLCGAAKAGRPAMSSRRSSSTPGRTEGQSSGEANPGTRPWPGHVRREGSRSAVQEARLATRSRPRRRRTPRHESRARARPSPAPARRRPAGRRSARPGAGARRRRA